MRNCKSCLLHLISSFCVCTLFYPSFFLLKWKPLWHFYITFSYPNKVGALWAVYASSVCSNRIILIRHANSIPSTNYTYFTSLMYFQFFVVSNQPRICSNINKCNINFIKHWKSLVCGRRGFVSVHAEK